MGETARGRPDVGCNPAFGSYAQTFQSAVELDASTAYKWMRRPAQAHGRVAIHARARFSNGRVFNKNVARHDQRAGPLARFDQSTIDQELIDAGFGQWARVPT